MTYQEFILSKSQSGEQFGFEPLWMPDFLFAFQKHLVERSLLKGRAAVFADCGLGKGPMQLVCAENVARKTNGRFLILTPLSVSFQMVREAEKFGIECVRSAEGKEQNKIVVTNYERLHYFNPSDFEGVACDESSILKNFDGATRSAITEFMRKVKYRFLWTATAAPNDYIELGTSSEALGELGYVDMLKMFFKSDNDSYAQGGRGGGRYEKNPFGGKFRFRGHAERDFWRWVCSWARAVRKPSDLGFSDEGFNLPPLETVEHVVKAMSQNPEYLIDLPATNLHEQRAERRRSINERCELAARLSIARSGASVLWCNLNDESDLLKRLIPGAEEIRGQDSDERKEELLEAFQSGQLKKLVTKSTITGFGCNWQHCAHETYFPSHSFEQWYQSVRRCWRFGQKNPVQVDMICSEGERGVLGNLKRKASAAENMFARLVELMTSELKISRTVPQSPTITLPSWQPFKNSRITTRPIMAIAAR